MPVDFQPIDFQPSQGSGVDFRPSTQPSSVHPSKMSDDDIALNLLKMNPQDWSKAKASGDYRPGMLAGGFTDPDSLTGQDLGKTALGRLIQKSAFGLNGIVSPPKNIESSWVGRVASGARSGFNAAAQLVSKARPDDGASEALYRALGQVNELNTKMKDSSSLAGVPEAVGQSIPMMMLTRGVPGAPAGANLATRVAYNGLPAAAATFATTPGDVQQRAQSSALALGIGGVAGEVSGVARTLLSKARAKAAKLGNTPSVQETLDQLGGRLGGQEPGEALQNAAKSKYDTAWKAAHEAYAPVDEAAGTQIDLSPAIAKLDEILNPAQKSLSPMHPAQRELLQKVLDNATELKSASLGDVQTVISDLGKNLNSLQRAHGSIIDRDAIEGVKNAFFDAIAGTSDLAAKDLSSANSVFAREVGPLIRNKQLTALRDTETPGDMLRSIAQGPLRNVKPEATAALAAGSSPDPILYQMYENALGTANGRPAGFIPSASKALPAVDALDPALGSTLRDQISVAEKAKTYGALMNFLGGKLFGTPAAMVASFNPGISGPGGAWAALQNDTLRGGLRNFGASRAGTSADDAFRAALMAELFGRQPGQGVQQR